MEYYMIYTVPVDENQMPIPPGLNGGIYFKEEANQIPVNIVSVDDIDAHISKLKEREGETVYDKVQGSRGGIRLHWKDPERNQIAFMQPGK